MTDKEKLDNLVAEIERLKKIVDDPILSDNDLIIGERNTYIRLLSFYDSMQKEAQVKESLISKYDNKTCKENDDSLTQEPISKELKEAANKYAIESYPDEPSTGQFGTGDYEPYVDMSGQRECAVEDFKAGAQWKEQQLMAKAVKGTARPDDNEIWCNLASSNLKDGDKVKVIVIKED